MRLQRGDIQYEIVSVEFNTIIYPENDVVHYILNFSSIILSLRFFCILYEYDVIVCFWPMKFAHFRIDKLINAFTVLFGT